MRTSPDDSPCSAVRARLCVMDFDSALGELQRPTNEVEFFIFNFLNIVSTRPNSGHMELDVCQTETAFTCTAV